MPGLISAFPPGDGPVVFHFAPTPLYYEVIAEQGIVPQPILDQTVVNLIPGHPVTHGIFVWHYDTITDTLLRDFLLVQFTKKLVWDGVLLAFRASLKHLWSHLANGPWNPNPDDDYHLSHDLDVDATAQGQRYEHRLHTRVPMDLYLDTVKPHHLHPVKRVSVEVAPYYRESRREPWPGPRR